MFDHDPDEWRFRQYAEGNMSYPYNNDSPVDLSGREGAPNNHCPKCREGLIEFISGDFNTGVVAPDGGKESRYEEGFQCDRCGYVPEDEEERCVFCRSTEHESGDCEQADESINEHLHE